MDLKDYALIKKATLTDIGDAFREKEGSAELVPVPDMAERISALAGGAVEHTTGSLTFSRSNAARTFPHGLSKAPKLFVCFLNGYDEALTVRIVALVYTEQLATLHRFVRTASTFTIQLESATVPGNSEITPELGAVTADENNVYVTATNSQWEAGDYTWEAYTW